MEEMNAISYSPCNCIYIYSGNFIKTNKTSKMFVCIFGVIVMMFFGYSIYAKYIFIKDFSINSNSTPFYINSEVSSNNVVINDNKGSLTLNIKNNDGTNFNSFEVPYSIYLEDTSKYSITTSDANNGKLTGGALKQNSITVNFVPDLSAPIKLNETIKLIVETSSPYKKQIVHEVNLNKPDSELVFGGLSDFRKIEEEDCEGYYSSHGYYADLYAGNNEKLQYDNEGNLVFDADNPILVMDIDESENLFQEEFSIYCTIKADTSQGERYGSTIISIGDGSGKYIGWISIFKGYLHVYTYVLENAGADFAKPTIQKGFGSYEISKYSNQIMNIQVTSSRTGTTKVYINGEKLTNFESGGASMPATHVTIGDLRPLRDLKFHGTIYDFSMYNSVLAEEEIKNNWNYAKNKWKINN